MLPLASTKKLAKYSIERKLSLQRKGNDKLIVTNKFILEINCIYLIYVKSISNVIIFNEGTLNIYSTINSRNNDLPALFKIGEISTV